VKPLRTEREWPLIGVYDVEAINWTNVTVVCHVDEAGNRKAFRDIGFYLDWLFREYPGDHVWAHWGGHYDHRFVIAEATKRGWSWETIQSGNMLIIVEVYHPERRRSIRFCDSSRLMPDALKEIGKTVNLPKLDVDRSHMENISIWETVRYCFRDCDIVIRGLQYMKEVLSSVGADFAYTLASIASRWVRRSPVLDWKEFFEEGNTYSQSMLAADEFCIPAYFGGRTEVFKVGTFDKLLHYYDVRSSYPWSMLHDLPAYFRGFRAPPDDTLEALMSCGVSEATVTVPPDTYLPILPVRHGGKLVFPVGTFRGRWTNIELMAAYEAGYKIELHTQAVYEPLPFLRPFIDTFYSLRRKAIENGDGFRKYAFKILLNSLYGKLIETVERQRTIFGEDKVNDAILRYGIRTPGETLTSYVKPTAVAGVYSVVTEEMGPFRHVAAGAYVTGRSRLLLHNRMQQVVDAEGELYYCDTDSLLTNLRLPEEPDALGNLKHEATIVEAQIVVPKVYRLVTAEGEEIYKVKGTPVAKGDGLTPSQMRARWDDYIRGEAIGREGISGFLTDLRQGRISPKKDVLARALRSSDSKRQHDGQGCSRPVTFGGEATESHSGNKKTGKRNRARREAA